MADETFVIIKVLGEIETSDGEVYPRAAIIQFSGEPPAWPLSIVWTGERMLLSRQAPPTPLPDVPAVSGVRE